MTEVLRASVAARAGGRCEYCQCPQYIGTSRFSVEHIVPSSRGGAEELANLALSCQGCNNIKYTRTTATDPETREVVPLFHPREHNREEHFAWSNDFLLLIGQTPIAHATVAALQLNRDEVVRFRRVLVLAGEHPPP